MTRNKKMTTAKKVGVGVGVAAGIAAAAGAYFLYGKNGAKNRKIVKGWLLKAKGEVLERLEAVDQISKEKYHEIVESVLRGYKSAKNASPAELAAAAAELKGHWNAIQKSLKKATGAKSSARKAKSKSAARKKSK